MEREQIEFNYFHRIFIKNIRKHILENERRKIGPIAETINDVLDFYINSPISKAEMLQIYDQTLFEICSDYVTLSNSTIDIFPQDTLEFVELILDTIHDNPYKESFLLSLQFIYQDYFDCLGKGQPTLSSSKDSESLSSLHVTLNSRYQIIEFHAVNMDDLVEQDKIMTKILLMESKNQIGPIPKVLHHVRKDI